MRNPSGLLPLYLFASTADTRAVCTGPEGLLLTGVGLYDDPNLGDFNAPLDRNMRWDDAGYQNSVANEFDVLHRLGIRARHGIILHDACWSLLEEVSLWHSTPISLQRLLDVCNSLPIPSECLSLSWGHDFGGVAITGDINYFPWEDRYDIREFREQDPVFSKNPYHIPGVDRILTEEPEQPPTFKQTTLSVSPQTLTTDRLALLPEELCIAIAIYLPTADVFRARLASRAFWPVFYSQQFWASRFKSSTDRSWLVEARDSLPRDWRWLYRRTNDAHISPGLRNRRRIWDLLQQVLDSLALEWRQPPPPFYHRDGCRILFYPKRTTGLRQRGCFGGTGRRPGVNSTMVARCSGPKVLLFLTPSRACLFTLLRLAMDSTLWGCFFPALLEILFTWDTALPRSVLSNLPNSGGCAWPWDLAVFGRSSASPGR